MSMQRSDGRFAEDFRQPCLQVGVLSQAQGSSFVEVGATKVMVGIFGPRESDMYRDSYTPQGRVTVDVSIMTLPSQPKVGPRKTSEELELARVVQSAIQSAILLEKFPKLVLDIRCTVLEKDGSVASAIINGTTMALVDAGIEMKDMVSACTMAMYGGNTMVIDPSGDEEKKGYATITMSIAPVSGMVTYMSCSGPWEESAFQKALKMGIVGCATYDGTMRTFLQNHALSLT